MNPRLKAFLVVCSIIAFLIALLFLVYYLNLLVNYILDPILVRPFERLYKNLIVDGLYAYLSTSTSSPALAFLATGFIVIAAFICLNKMLLPLQEKIINNYTSFKNNNIDSNSMLFEVYKDPTIKLKDKILFFSIHLIYYLQLPFLYIASKVSALREFLIFNFGLLLLNYALLIPVALLELIKYPSVKLFSPLGLNVKQLSFLFNVSDVGTGSQSVHTRSFEESTIKCAKELKEKYGAPSNELDEEFKSYISGLTSQQKRMIEPYLRLDGYETGEWVNWVDSKTGLTLTQAINLVLIAARKQNSDVELLKSILLVRFDESNRQCGPGMLLRIIYALNGLEAENNFAAQLEPWQIGELARYTTKRFFERYVDKHYYKIKVLKENFDDLYSPSSEVDLSNVSDEVKDGISYTRDAIKEFVFKELYVKFYNDYGEHIQRGQIKQRLRELITDEVVDAAIYSKIDEIEIPAEPPTYLERVKAFFGGHARSSAA
ncbi:hypothetical protein ACT91P_04005 [Wolbachia pipientis]|uniref:hypothetical protein n=1 Tax=Wolbachia TaxID=953 RepID=UPI00004CA641|nr:MULTISPECIES: hypothetical protein [Wolbachia]EAL59891.1 conserved hypothetical protein [Wolbachia endosymbiont of Drosophila simulans]MDX5497569.1 hypothetical protein [Wolbachia endosymbiont of Lasioglossum nitidulum]MDX5509900.1 hypothetical protein [Wolbachia endosymbiont of Lasioglossum morio]MDX5543724.1 hypothetical protein [Wolbachia endosymbiont of Andrena apicata]MDX5561694.1 hypothetical protein [Wolbachia endosymbiont of Andrena bicolor]POG51766.1 hypothetical protein BJU59_038